MLSSLQSCYMNLDLFDVTLVCEYLLRLLTSYFTCYFICFFIVVVCSTDGNGFKTSTMRLGADAIVFSRASRGR